MSYRLGKTCTVIVGQQALRDVEECPTDSVRLCTVIVGQQPLRDVEECPTDSVRLCTVIVSQTVAPEGCRGVSYRLGKALYS